MQHNNILKGCIIINIRIFSLTFFILLAWKNNPQERISFLKILGLLKELHDSVKHIFENLPALLPNKSLDLDGSITEELISPVIPIIPIIPLYEGIRASRMNDHKKAWQCFEYHAANDNKIAKYWKGRYLWEGLHDGKKEREEGKKLLKEAADEEYPDAQLYYAFTLKNVLNVGDNRKTYIDYVTKAAKGNNDIAQYNLGKIYYEGEFNIPQDENEGIKWLRKAALRDNARAIKLLNDSRISLY